MYEVQVSTALPRPRYFVVDHTTSGARVVGNVFGHTTQEAAQDELVNLTYSRAYALVANAPETWESKSQEELDKSARTLVKNGYAYPANTEGRALHMGQADALTDIYGANQR